MTAGFELCVRALDVRGQPTKIMAHGGFLVDEMAKDLGLSCDAPVDLVAGQPSTSAPLMVNYTTLNFIKKTNRTSSHKRIDLAPPYEIPLSPLPWIVTRSVSEEKLVSSRRVQSLSTTH